MTPRELSERLGRSLTQLAADRHPAYCARYDYAGQYALDESGEITALNLRGMALAEDPGPWLAELPRLRYLNLSECGLIELTLPELPELIVLNVSRNAELSALNLPTTFPKLLRADLSRCVLTSVHWPACAQLEWLDASRSQLSEWQFTGGCPQLIYFEIRDNKLTKLMLPGPMDQLHYLYAGSNQLQEFDLPREVPALNILDLRGNELRELPVRDYPKLEALTVKGNPLTGYEEGFIKGDEAENATEIITLLRERARGGEEPNYRAKLIIVGNGRVGKTCLVQRLRGEVCRGDEAYTHGISISRLTKAHLPDVESADLDLRVWDFGGQEVFYATHQFFLSEEAVYIYAWTDQEIALANRDRDQVQSPRLVRERWRDHEYWLDNIRMHGKGSPILPVRTHCREARSGFPLERLQRDYTLRYEPLDFEARTGDSAYYLARLKTELTRLVDSNSLLGRPFPKTFARLIEDLDERRRNLDRKRNPLGELSLDDFRVLAQERKIAAESHGDLLSYLRKTGEIVYYPDNKKLSGRLFIDPEALTRQVYRLLEEHDELTQRKGTFDAAYAQDIFGAAHGETLLELLISFDLVFRKKTNQGVQYIAPQYLPALRDNPDNVDWLAGQKAEKKLQFELRYPRFIPENVMINVLSHYGPYSVGNVYSDAIYFVTSESRAGCALEMVRDGRAAIISVYTADSSGGRDTAADVYRQFKDLSKKAELHIADGATRQWVETKMLDSAGEENRDIPTLEGEWIDKGVGFAFLRQREVRGEKEHLPGGKIAKTPKKVLFLCSSPRGLAKLPLDFSSEFNNIEEARRGATLSHQFAPVGIKTAVKKERLVNILLEEQPDVLHIALHGSKQRGLYFEDAVQRPDNVLPEEFADDIELYHSYPDLTRKIEAIIFSACDSLPHAEAVLPHVRYTVAMCTEIPDDAMVDYAKKFYELYFEGIDLAYAHKVACSAIKKGNYQPQDGIPAHEIPVFRENHQYE